MKSQKMKKGKPGIHNMVSQNATGILPGKLEGRLQSVYRIVAAVMIVLMFVLLATAMLGMPEIGDKNNPDNNEVARRYIENGLDETGAVNIVSGMILDYRAFDTFGESCVLFVATICVTIMLRIDGRGGAGDDEETESSKKAFGIRESAFAKLDNRNYEPENDTILRKSALIVFPIIMVFGVYVILNGHISPGGGFSGGAILGAGFVLFLSAFGFNKTERFMNANTVRIITLVALLVYCLSKCYSFFTGANHLESGIPLGTPGAILSSGLILVLNICVGMVVACTMYSFYALVRRGRI
jgi:multicomponent Na+:H+ antiporter subunit B